MQLIIEYRNEPGSKACELGLSKGMTHLNFRDDFVSVWMTHQPDGEADLILEVDEQGLHLSHIKPSLNVSGLSAASFKEPIKGGAKFVIEGLVLRFVAPNALVKKQKANFIVETTKKGGSAADYISLLGSLRGLAEPNAIVERLLAQLTIILGAERGLVLLKDENGKFVPVTVSGAKDKEQLLAISSTVCQAAMDGDEVLVIEDSLKDLRCATAASMKGLPFPRFIVCAPLKTTEECFGVVYVDRPKFKAAPPVELELLSLVTTMTAELIGRQSIRAQLVAAHHKVAEMSSLSQTEDDMVTGDGQAALALRGQLEKAAAQDVTVLITGETGTGKEMVARSLHQKSSRKNGPFVPVNCAALAQELIDAELFGVEKGAYTGAGEGRLGRFELAEGGTLFLDELGELPESTQVKLLRVLQERVITRVGGTVDRPVDFRLVCATNRDLAASITEGQFRKDLYFRVNVFQIHLLPLRQRRDEIALLANHFLAIYAKKFNKHLPGFAKEALQALHDYDWPGNVREIGNVIERAALMTKDDSLIELDTLPLTGGRVLNKADLEKAFWDKLPEAYEESREVFEKTYLRRLLEKHHGNLRAAARTAGFPRSTLYRRMKKYGFIIEEKS